jgi:hypothetical protein
MLAMHQRQEVQKVRDSYDSTHGLLSVFLQEKLVPKDCFHETTGRLRFMLQFENKSIMLMW